VIYIVGACITAVMVSWYLAGQKEPWIKIILSSLLAATLWPVFWLAVGLVAISKIVHR